MRKRVWLQVLFSAEQTDRRPRGDLQMPTPALQWAYGKRRAGEDDTRRTRPHDGERLCRDARPIRHSRKPHWRSRHACHGRGEGAQWSWVQSRPGRCEAGSAPPGEKRRLRRRPPRHRRHVTHPCRSRRADERRGGGLRIKILRHLRAGEVSERKHERPRLQSCPRWSSQPTYSDMDAFVHRFADQMKERVCASAGVNALVEDFLVPVMPQAMTEPLSGCRRLKWPGSAVNSRCRPELAKFIGTEVEGGCLVGRRRASLR